VTRAMKEHLITLAVILTTAAVFYDATLLLASAQRTNYLWEGWHKVPDPSRIQYKVFHDRVVALSNLSKGGKGCSSFTFAGKIAKANFDQQGLMVQSFVLETNDGERPLINVDPMSFDDPEMNRADMGWIVQGLQTLLHANSYIQGSAFACGAAGRVLMLDKISSIMPSSKPPNTTALAPKDLDEGQPQSQSAQTGNNAEGIPLLGPSLFLFSSMVRSP
jgi:hypothetical protein